MQRLWGGASALSALLSTGFDDPTDSAAQPAITPAQLAHGTSPLAASLPSVHAASPNIFVSPDTDASPGTQWSLATVATAGPLEQHASRTPVVAATAQCTPGYLPVVGASASLHDATSNILAADATGNTPGGRDDLLCSEEAVRSGMVGRDRPNGLRTAAAKQRRRKQYKVNKKLKLASLAQEPSAQLCPAATAPTAGALREAALREAALRAMLRDKTELVKLERKRSRRDAVTLTQRVRQQETAKQKARVRKKKEMKVRKAAFAARRDDNRKRKGKPLPDAPLHSSARKAQRLIASNPRPPVHLSRP